MFYRYMAALGGILARFFELLPVLVIISAIATLPAIAMSLLKRYTRLKGTAKGVSKNRRV